MSLFREGCVENAWISFNSLLVCHCSSYNFFILLLSPPPFFLYRFEDPRSFGSRLGYCNQRSYVSAGFFSLAV